MWGRAILLKPLGSVGIRASLLHGRQEPLDDAAVYFCIHCLRAAGVVLEPEGADDARAADGAPFQCTSMHFNVYSPF